MNKTQYKNIFEGSEYKYTKQTNRGGRRKLNVYFIYFIFTEIQIQRALKLSNDGNQMKET